MTPILIVTSAVPIVFCPLQMVSTERVLNYTRLPSESALETAPGIVIPQKWPDRVTILFNHVSVAYSADTKTVLEDIHCMVEGGQKVPHY